MGLEFLIFLSNPDVQLGQLIPPTEQDVLEHKRLGKTRALGKKPVPNGVGGPGRTLPVCFVVLSSAGEPSRGLLEPTRYVAQRPNAEEPADEQGRAENSSRHSPV